MLAGAVSQSSILATRATGQRAPGRSARPLCLASRQSNEGSASQNPLFSAAVAVTLAGGLMLADAGAVQASQGDVYEKLGIAPPSGAGGIVVSAPEKKTLFQSRSSAAVKKAPKPAPAPAPAPAAKTQESRPKPKPAAKPAPKPTTKLATKKPAQKKASKASAPTKVTKSTPLKLSKDSIKTTTQGSLSPGLKVPKPSSGDGKLTLVKPKLKQPPPPAPKKTKAAAAAAGAGAAAAGFSLPKFELPSFSAPSISAPSVSLPGGANDTQQALAVAGAEVFLALIASSVVGGLFSKKATKA